LESPRKWNKNKDNSEDEESDENSTNGLLGGLLDDKNIIEINNMVMNMDKIVQVRDFA